MKIRNLFLLILLSCAVIQANPNLPTQPEEQIPLLEKFDPKKTSIICAVASPLLLLVGCGAGFIGAIGSAGRPGGRTPPIHPLVFIGLGNIAASIGTGILGYKVYKYHHKATLDAEIESLEHKLQEKLAKRRRLFGQ